MKATKKSVKERETNSGSFPIVAIGASAGGIQALKVFFENVPSDTGIAYVVILHLSPNHDSKLAEVIRFSDEAGGKLP